MPHGTLRVDDGHVVAIAERRVLDRHADAHQAIQAVAQPVLQLPVTSIGLDQVQEATLRVEQRMLARQTRWWQFDLADAVGRERARHDHSCQTMVSIVCQREIARQGWLDIRVDQEDAIPDVCQQAAQVGGYGCFAYAAFGGDHSENEHLNLAELW